MLSINKLLKINLFILFTFMVTACASLSPPIAVPKNEPSSERLKHIRPKVILVLGSGSARGFAHAGVLKVLEDNHIPIDMIVGTSAGSIVGSLYADHPSATWLNQLLLRTTRSDVIDYSLMNINQGLISGVKLQQFLLNHMQARSFDQLQIPFVAIATDLSTGKKHVFASGPIAPAVNASSAAPPFFRPVKLYGRTYVDGALVDPIAVDVAKKFHPKIIIAVSLNYALAKDIPTNSSSVFIKSFDMMVLQLNDFSAEHAQVIIRPEPKDISMFDGSKGGDLIKEGEMAAEKALPTIRKLLAEKHIALR